MRQKNFNSASKFHAQEFLRGAVCTVMVFTLSGCSWLQAFDDSITQTVEELIKARKYQAAEDLCKSDIEREKGVFEKSESSDLDKSAGKAPSARYSQETKKHAVHLANAYKNLALIYFATGKYSLAEPAYADAIRVYATVFGRDNLFVANNLHSLAASYYKQGKLMDAETYYKQEIESLEAMHKADPLKLALTANNLAAIYQRLGQDDEAERYFSWALSLCAGFKSSNKQSDQMVDILNNLSLFYEKEGDFDKALEMVNKALDIEAKRSKGFSENRVRSLLVRASIQKATFNLDSSEEDYRECLDLISSSKTPQAELSCETLDKYADLLLLQRKFKEAEPEFEACIKACETAHGPNHPTVAERLSDFSVLYKRTERYAEAESLLRRALAIEEKTIGIDTPEYLTTVHRLATVLTDEGRAADADQLYKEVLPKLTEMLGPDHPFIADTLDNWSEFVEKSRGKLAAEELHERARLIRRKLAHSLSPRLGPEKPH